MSQTYVITEACIGVKDATCVEVCPAACIHTTPEAPQYYIDPEVCIACEQCVIVCPVQAIFLDDDVPAHLQDYLEVNSRFFRDVKETAPPLTQEQAALVLAAARRYATNAGIEAAIAVVGPAGEPMVEASTAGVAPEAAAAASDKA
jgi:NAD-dependent dihydropyrimidine dehydrogenase PreA subunit